jgi:hypothetical protein
VDWAKAIEINQAALARIVAALFAMLGLAEGGVPERPPRAVYLAVLRILRPAESAVRRLIVIVARGLTAEPLAPARPMPDGLAIARKRGGHRVSFQLFDTRKRFNFGPPGRRTAKILPASGSADPTRSRRPSGPRLPWNRLLSQSPKAMAAPSVSAAGLRPSNWRSTICSARPGASSAGRPGAAK